MIGSTEALHVLAGNVLGMRMVGTGEVLPGLRR